MTQGFSHSGQPVFTSDFTAGGLDSRLTHTRASNATQTDATGATVWADANMLLNSATLATQDVTVVVGNTYTLSGYGTGSVALSAGASGTLEGTGAANRVSVTFTATTTTATFTVTGSITSAQLNPGATAQPYHATTTTAYYAPRFDHDPTSHILKGLLYEAQSTNYLRNNTMVGGVAGTLSSGASYPTNWAGYTSSTTGMTRTLAYGTENGLSYIDHRIYGTPSANYYQLFFETVTGIAGVQGNIYTASNYMRLLGGSTANITGIKLGIQENNSSSSYLSSGTGSSLSLSSSFPSTPYNFSRTLQSASTAYVRPYLQLEWPSGQSIDITLRIYQPQFEKASTYSTPISTSGYTATRAADALSFTIPNGVSTLRYVYGDNSTQDVSVSAGAYTVPTNLNRAWIKRIVGFKL